MLFIETVIFTKRAKELLDDDTYRALQVSLAMEPCAGDLLEGTGGLRKIRVASKGHGKRGGARVIYYHLVAASQIACCLSTRRTSSTTCRLISAKR